ncbi:MAG: DNA repair protein RecO [Chlamydiia bacterium]|nr:DNA repair protein RecO [Chlamydiia bacterium]
MNNETSTAAIILKATPFKETKVILQLFTEVFGPASCIVSTKKLSHLSSMMLIEGNLRRGRGDLYTLSEPYILDAFANLRKDFDLLQLCAKLMNTLSRTLVKERSVAPLFLLTKNTLKAFSIESNNKAIYLCFLLKLLLFEGLLPLHPERVSKDLTEDEKLALLTLATAKNFSELDDIEITPSLEEAIEDYLLATVH